MNVTKLTSTQLAKLQKQIPMEIEKRRLGEKKKLIKQLTALAMAKGFSLKDLLTNTAEPKKEPAKRKPVAIKYRHPSKSDLTWTGRGKKPKWVTEWLAQGKTMESLSV